MKIEDIQPKAVTCRQSSMGCAVSCERCWFFQYRWGVTLRGREIKEAATLGTIYHKFQQLGPGKEQEVRAWVRGQQAELMAQADRGEDIDGNMVRLANLMTSLYHKAETMAQLFWEKYPQPSYLRSVGTELKLSMEYEGLTLEGTIDKLLENTQDGFRWIRDHKSTGRPLSCLFGGLAWSLQARMYRILVENYLGGDFADSHLTVHGFIMDGILKPGIKLCGKDDKEAKKQNITPEEAYLRRVREWYKTEETDKGRPTILSRSLIYNEPLFPKELTDALNKMRNLIDRPVHPDNFSRDITRMACFQWEKQCIYHDLCEAPFWRYEELFQTKYRIAEEPAEEEND